MHVCAIIDLYMEYIWLMISTVCGCGNALHHHIRCDVLHAASCAA
jgi:hypothetical protein